MQKKNKARKPQVKAPGESTYITVKIPSKGLPVLILSMKNLAKIKKHCNLVSVFIGYGLKTGQGFHPGPIY